MKKTLKRFFLLRVFVICHNSNMKKNIEEYSIKHVDLEGKKVIMRVDFNVGFNSDGDLEESSAHRIHSIMESLEYLHQRAEKVFLISHIGRKKTDSLKKVFNYISEKIDIAFIADFSKESVDAAIKAEQKIILFENTRAYDEEKENNISFLQELISASDCFVNEAFSVSHRKHASIHGIAEKMNSYIGLHFLQEYQSLSELQNFKEKKTLLLGGAKFGTKLALVEKFAQDFDYILLGGALANPFLRARGFEIGKSFSDNSVDVKKLAFNEKIILPLDYVDQYGDIAKIDEVRGEDVILDIGPETVELFSQILNHSDVVIWNGPMGKYEDGFDQGTEHIFEKINADIYSVIGGGDSVSVLLSSGFEEKFSFVSTAGGAMLEFLLYTNLVALDAIIKK